MSDVIVALDVTSRERALALVDRLGEAATFYKVGLELYTREGPDVVRELRARGKRVFLDLKLMDIPNTVAGAVRAAADHEVDLLTVHAVGGADMMRKAVEAGGGRLRLLAVTVLTSSGPDALADAWGRDRLVVRDEVVRLAGQARSAGISGVVSSVAEVSALRERLGPEAFLVTPGIRLAGGDLHDQMRVATPADAVRGGADALVVGRAITGAADPADALARVLDEVTGALA